MSGPERRLCCTALHARELGRVPDPAAVLEALAPSGLPWLLESALEAPQLGRFSFVGADPYALVRARGAEARLEVRRPVRPDLPSSLEERVGDPLESVRAWMPPPPESLRGAARCPAPFVGGAVGYLGYELANFTLPVQLRAPADLDMPDLALLLCDRLLAIDHLEARTWVLGLGFGETRAKAESAAEAASGTLAADVAGLPGTVERLEPARTAAPWLDAPGDAADAEGELRHARGVREILDEIAAGNVYQANLTHRIERQLPGASPFALYRALRALNPAPFAAYLGLPEATVLSSSPERFLRLDADGRVESRPIKGTRPRGRGAAADRRLARALRESEKDRAENLMIVDLVRNDLGRVCETGSVEVPELMGVEPYAAVHHLVSTVTGRLRDDCDAVDLVRATFPPGSMTGAPKRAAVQLIDRLEPVRRGVYSGALGYLDVRGGADLAVVIRTLVLAGHRACLHVGGGVVADSEPAAEWQESLDKARALLAALARVGAAAHDPASGAASSSG